MTNISYNMPVKSIRVHAAWAGEVQHFHMPMNDAGDGHKDHAWITYAAESGALAAIAWNGTNYGGRVLRVQHAHDPGA